MGAARIDNHAAERNPATAHMFIINPLHAHKYDSLFATHPATENRIAALRAMSAPSGRSSGTVVPPVSRSRVPKVRNGKNSGPWT
tara:strand:+ start:226 stop:480 length:255 start_codon:yes stop_codon:yes gene_type:complete